MKRCMVLLGIILFPMSAQANFSSGEPLNNKLEACSWQNNAKVACRQLSWCQKISTSKVYYVDGKGRQEDKTDYLLLSCRNIGKLKILKKGINQSPQIDPCFIKDERVLCKDNKQI